MTIQGTRLGHLKKLVAKHGGVVPFAKLVDKEPTRIRQLIGRHKAIGEATAREFERKLGLENGHMDLAHELSADDVVAFEELTDDDWISDAANSAPVVGMTPILAWLHEDDLPPGEYVFIPRMDVQLSAGDGKDQIEIEFTKVQPQAFRAEWIRRKRLKPKALACMYASGESMSPRIHDGDSLVVDVSQRDVKDGGVYALWYDGGERVKRLYRIPGGGLIVRSDNEQQFPDLVLTPAEAEHVRIIGRVVHVSGDGGL